MTERSFNLVVPLAHEATAMRITDTAGSSRGRSGAVSLPNIRPGDVESTMGPSPAGLGIRTSTTATRTTTTRTTSSALVPSADWSVQGHAEPVVAILFARADSHYKDIPGCDVFDMDRDARTYDGPYPVVAHPPCRAWGRLRAFANPRPDERNLGRLAVALVREFGGVLEHPAGSKLWPAQKLPRPGERDSFGGWTLAAPQKWWGHKAEKSTWFYVVGCEPGDIPEMPLVLGEADYVVQSRKRKDYRPHISKAEREHTPPPLAAWLCALARKCGGKQ